MCGINFILDKKSQLHEDSILRMNEATRHRGNEGNHIHCHKSTKNTSLWFGHNRLKIIDLSEDAKQPFISDCRKYMLIYNGEIYNYLEIRKALEKNYSFRSQSDTEVLLNYLIESIQNPSFSIDFPLNGMYAFVFFDSLEEKIWIGRDEQGIKPLYYYENEDYLLISSEIKGILASALVEKKLNERQIYHYLQFKFAQKPETFFEGIYECQQKIVNSQWTIANSQWTMDNGQWTVVNGQWIMDSSQWAMDNVNKSYGLKTMDYALSLNKLNLLLKKAVERQLRADVPVGIFLSGGVDSTLLLAIMRELGYAKIPSFSAINSSSERHFGTKDYHFARLAARQYGSEHHEILTDSNTLNEFEILLAQIDQPIGDSASLLTYLISKEAKKQVKVVLSGAGADELFAGYNRHGAFYQYLKYQKIIQTFYPLLKNSKFLFPDGFVHPLRKKFRLIQKFIKQLDKSPEQTFINFTKLNTNSLFHKPAIFYKNSPLGLEGSTCQSLEKALNFDRNNYLVSDVLKLSDNMSMLHSLELRVPYLDKDILNFVHQIPASELLRRGKKWLLKDLLSQKGGQIYTQRPKEGFGMPISQWLRAKEWKFLAEDLLNPKNILYKYISPQETCKLVKAHLHHKADYSSEIWALLVLSAWLERNF